MAVVDAHLTDPGGVGAAGKAMVWNGTDWLPTDIATQAELDAVLATNDAMIFKGVIDCSANPNYPAADRGHTYKVSVAGKIGGGSGTNVEVNDVLICITDGTAAGTQVAVGAQWVVVQANIDGAVTGPASSTGDNLSSFNGAGGKVIKDSGVAISTDGTLASNSDAKTPTEKATKTYADTGLAGKASTAHHTSHEPSGSDAMAVDAAAATGSLRTLGTGATQAVAGNDSRLSDARTPVGTALTSARLWVGNGSNLAAAVAPTGDVTIDNAGVTAIGAGKVTLAMLNAAVKPSGSAADADEGVRALGYTTKLAAPGSDMDLLLKAPKQIITRNGQLDAATANDYGWSEATAAWSTSNLVLSKGMFRLDPATLATISGRTKRVKVRGVVWSNAVDPGTDIAFRLYPITPLGGTATQVTATVGTLLCAATVTDASIGATAAVTFDSGTTTFPAVAGDYVCRVNIATNMAASSSIAWVVIVEAWSE